MGLFPFASFLSQSRMQCLYTEWLTWFVRSWKGLEFSSRLEKSLNLVRVLEKYFISLFTSWTVLESHYLVKKYFCVVGQKCKIIWSTMAEEVKIVNDSLMCFSHSSVQGRIKNAEFFNKSFSLKNPWKVCEICVWSRTNHGLGGRERVLTTVRTGQGN